MNYFIKPIKAIGLIVCLLMRFEAFAERGKLPPSLDSISINIIYMQANDSDTLTLEIGHRYFGEIFLTQPAIYKATKNNKGKFSFAVPVKYASGYFRLTKKKTFTYKGGVTDYMYLLDRQYWESGDNIEISINHWERPGVNSSLCHFSGPGSEKYKVREAIRQLKQIQQSISGVVSETVFQLNKDEIYNRQIETLEKYKSKISSVSYEISNADIAFDGKGYYYYAKEKYRLFLKEGKAHSADKLRDSIVSQMAKDEQSGHASAGSSFSHDYLYFAYQKAKCLSFFKDTTDTPEKLFKEIVENYNGDVRDALLLYFFRTERLPEDTEKLYKTAERLATNRDAKQALSEYKTTMPGRTLDNYSFADINGKPVRLSDFDDKLVLLDLYFNGCGGCATYYRDILSKVEHKFRQNPNVVFVSISIDLTFNRWKEGLKSGLYTSSEATNLYTGGLGFRHPLIVDNNIYAYPTAILLGKGRRVLAFNTTAMYNYNVLVSEIEKLL